MRAGTRIARHRPHATAKTPIALEHAGYARVCSPRSGVAQQPPKVRSTFGGYTFASSFSFFASSITFCAMCAGTSS